ncbi:hypothetical protein FA15DRAFT_702096 [Coprinopsis marcescibilis]|uniref:Uncharacterized protein n=1 Tax=Coprinopsis marcescibilis TaxID=230819 RepID=A0A5C3L576_COPMA|nr:hypothetical protein FA15DRAFT_702096 [Coprinopsis marcescibilis]
MCLARVHRVQFLHCRQQPKHQYVTTNSDLCVDSAAYTNYPTFNTVAQAAPIEDNCWTTCRICDDGGDAAGLMQDILRRDNRTRFFLSLAEAVQYLTSFAQIRSQN